MRVAGRENVQNNMGHFRTALMVLTGVDKGTSQDLWIEWWNGIRYDRGKKRGDRGQDPEKDD